MILFCIRVVGTYLISSCDVVAIVYIICGTKQCLLQGLSHVREGCKNFFKKDITKFLQYFPLGVPQILGIAHDPSSFRGIG